MKKIYSLVFALIFSISLNAQSISPEQAETVARNFYSERSNHLIIDKNATTEFFLVDKLIADNGKILGYIFNAESGKGFVIVSAFNNTIPVLAYSLTKAFDKTREMPPSVEAILTDYKRQLILASTSTGPVSAEIESLWEYYLTSKGTKDVDAAGPLLSTTWDQGCYYNADCPYDASTGSYYCYHVPTGCGATAQAQIMKYWSWPVNGLGSNSYNSSYGTLSANFASATYNWNSMPNYLNTNNAEVAEIMSHVGISVNMNYSPSGSSSYISDHRYSFVNNFNYKNTASIENRSSYSDAGWAALLKGQIDAGKPVFYTGFDANGTSGHAFVCDGYQGSGYSTDYFHFNFGWGGYYDGYYSLNDISPGTGGTGGGSGDYSYYNQIIKDIEPNGTPNPGGGCDTIYNYSSSDNPTYYGFTTSWGYWTGQNGYGWNEFAEKFSSPSKPVVNGLYVAVAKADYFNSSSKVTFKVYNGGTTPGSVLATKNVYYSSLTPGYWNLVEFTNPITTTGNFYIGYEVYYTSPQDTFAVYVSEIPTATNTAYVKDGSTWHPYTDMYSSFYSHLWMDAIVCSVISDISKPEKPEAFVYPNPATDILNIFGINEIFTAVIYDHQGRIAINENVEKQINVSSLEAGMYYIIGYNENGEVILNKKFLKE